MITSELISYIKKQKQKNISKDLITSKLLGVGWLKEDIDEGFLNIAKEEPKSEVPLPDIKEKINNINNSVVKEKESVADKYREPVAEDTNTDDGIWDLDKDQPEEKGGLPKMEINPFGNKKYDVQDKVNSEKKEEVKVDLPKEPELKNGNVEIAKENIIPKVNLNPFKEKTDNTTKTETIKSEIPKVELPKQPETPKEVEPKVEESKIWTPMSVPIKEKTQNSNNSNTEENKKTQEPHQIEIQNLELQSKELSKDKSEQALPPVVQNNNIKQDSSSVKNKLPQQETIDNPKIESSIVDLQNPKKSEGLIPNIMPKMATSTFGSINTKPQENIPIPQNINQTDSSPKSLPKSAMLSSYQNDLLSANKINKQVVNVKKRSSAKFIALILIIIAISSVAFAFTTGYVKLEDLGLNLNFSFIKKNPKVLLLENSKVLSSLHSYKTETNIEISSPSFSNISEGLISGEVISAIEKDYISIKTTGSINQAKENLISNNSITIESSLFTDTINTYINNNGADLFVSVPDLSQVTKDNVSESSVVKVSEDQSDLIASLFDSNIKSRLEKINIYKILSKGILSYINSENLVAYDEFINSVSIIEKGEENIKGIDMYHYSINPDRLLTKNLLTEISNGFVLNLSAEDESNLDQILSSVTVKSFDVWIGKNDNNIYQYNVVLGVPLSKVIGFEDKSIGDNNVDISWKTTFFDFNVSNNISIPDMSVPMADFVKDVEERKLKNKVSSFSQLASNLFNVNKNYGAKSNTKGSCISPTSGSLFSPTGHTESTTEEVSSISLFLNEILENVSDTGTCYSTSKSWSFAIPISDNYDPSSVPEGGYTNFFCVDSDGFSGEAKYLPAGTKCPIIETEEVVNDTPLETF